MPGLQLTNAINRTVKRIPAWSVYVLGLLIFGFIMALVITNNAGPDPVKALEKGLGERGLQFLVVALCLTPLRWAGINAVKFRRAVGLVAFFFIALHFATWVVLDMGLRWSEIISDLYKRPYILIGFGAFLGMIPLAITSNNRSIKQLGAATWKRLHLLAYPATLAGAVHFVMIGKVYALDSLFYLAVVVAVLAARWVKARGTSAILARVVGI